MTNSRHSSPVKDLFAECERARSDGDLISKVSANDKEFHFQNWVQGRIQRCGLDFDEPGRNTYPDFRLVQTPIGFEVKGLAWPGRESDYDSNSQVPTGIHNGRSIYYVFGRYPSDVRDMPEYPVTDLVICHGDFLNATRDYVHKNKSFRGFGSYGDILIRDRKMYVVPTPFALVKGLAGLATLILPEHEVPTHPELKPVGLLSRTEVDEVVVAYEFNLLTNEMVTLKAPNPNAGAEHRFVAYRLAGHGETKPVEMQTPTGQRRKS